MSDTQPSHPVKNPPKLSVVDAHLLRGDADFLARHFNIEIIGTENELRDVRIRLPETLKTPEAVDAYLQAALPGVSYKTETPERPGAPAEVAVGTYVFKDAVARIRKPLSHRTLNGIEKKDRVALEEEYQRMLGLPMIGELERIDHHKSMEETMKELRKQRRVEFMERWHDGKMHLPVKDEKGALFAIAARAMDRKLIADADLALMLLPGEELNAPQKELILTPRGIAALNRLALSGIKGQGGEPDLQGVGAELVTAERERCKQGLRLAEERARMKLALATETTAAPAVNYDRAAMLRGVDTGLRFVNEPGYWQALEASQMASGANTIRDDLREELTDLKVLLSDPALTQKEAQWVVNNSVYAATIRDTGYLLAQAAEEKKPGFVRQALNAYMSAFSLTEQALQPADGNVKDAAYFLRSQLGKVSMAEKIASNAYMGIKPIWHSVQLAVEKPAVVGVAGGALLAYSAAVPPKYRIYNMLNGAVHSALENLGLHSHDHGDPGVLKLGERIRGQDKAFMRKNPGFKTGYRMGFGSALMSLGAGFVVFNLVEDVIVHLPLALVSVAVGAAGGATGRKVVTPILEDLGDIAGRLAPDDVRKAWVSDWKQVEKIYANSSMKSTRAGFAQFGRDVEELGLIPALMGLNEKTPTFAAQVNGEKEAAQAAAR